MIRAVIGDTWQQSKQQVVFIVMLALMVLVLVAGIALPRAIVTSDGEKHFGTLLSERPVPYFAQQWVNEYAKTLGGDDEASLMATIRTNATDTTLSQKEKQDKMQALLMQQQRLRSETVAKATNIPEYQRAVEYYIHFVVGGMFKLTMLLFIAACAGYFPAMLGSGAVDIVMSKPLSRLKIYCGKYVGGIFLYTAAIVAFNTLLFFGIGMRTGIWHARIFYSIPLLVFSAMVLYAMLALVGTISKSSTMALVTGYLFYIVLDSIVGALLNIKPQLVQLDWESVAGFITTLGYVLPNFGMMNDMALASLLNAPVFQATPFIVALVWLLACLGLGYWVFERRDY